MLAGFSVLFSACYTLKQGVSLLGYLNKAVPLESLVNEPEDERFVDEVTEIRRFAVEELGLNASKNYTTYVQLDRNYLAAVVSASKKDSFSRYEWWFPVVGYMPYKGFFNPDDARHEVEKLKKKDLDVLMRPVDAFSTLGWFKDPLYSFMKEYSSARLADLIIHESFHATVFLKNSVQFNEELAEFVGTEGARLYVAKKFGIDSDEYRELDSSNEENAVYIAYIKELIAQLEELYQRDIPRDKKLQEKETIISASKERFNREYEHRFSTDRYRFFSELNINNAYLELYRLYHERENHLKKLYADAGCNLPAFIAAAKTLTTKSPPLEQLEAALKRQ